MTAFTPDGHKICGHRGAPVTSVYTKFPSVARCDDCAWSEKAADGDDPALMRTLRRNALEHAAQAHHRVVIRLGQMVVLEPKNPRTREKALEARVR